MEALPQLPYIHYDDKGRAYNVIDRTIMTDEVFENVKQYTLPGCLLPECSELDFLLKKDDKHSFSMCAVLRPGQREDIDNVSTGVNISSVDIEQFVKTCVAKCKNVNVEEEDKRKRKRISQIKFESCKIKNNSFIITYNFDSDDILYSLVTALALAEFQYENRYNKANTYVLRRLKQSKIRITRLRENFCKRYRVLLNTIDYKKIISKLAKNSGIIPLMYDSSERKFQGKCKYFLNQSKYSFFAVIKCDNGRWFPFSKRGNDKIVKHFKNLYCKNKYNQI